MSKIQSIMLTAICASLALVSCQHDAYDVGTSTDYKTCMAYVRLTNGVVSAIDADDIGALVPPASLDLSTSYDNLPADTTVRFYMLYIDNGAGQPVDLRQIAAVSMPRVIPSDSLDISRQSDIEVATQWMSRSNSLINLQLAIPTDGRTTKYLSIGCDSVSVAGRGAANISLYYDANSSGEYYTLYPFFTLPFDAVVPVQMKPAGNPTFSPDTVRLTYSSGSGMKTYTYIRSGSTTVGR